MIFSHRLFAQAPEKLSSKFWINVSLMSSASKSGVVASGELWSTLSEREGSPDAVPATRQDL